ncbi:MAG TPA: Hpt domain-containing protein, partial [Rhodopila sp.]|nr:Hpt domain-containing protein [Rhodopila sp.]
MNPLAQFRQTYFEECAELLDALQSNLEALSNGAGDEETLHAIFRAVHSIKGGAGAFGFTALVTFSHLFENVLDALRDGTVAATQGLIHLLTRASDALADIVAAARDDTPLPDGFASDIMAALQAALAESPATSSPATAASATSPVTATDGTGAAERCYRITFIPRTELLERGNEPLLLVRQLRRLGTLGVETDTSRLPRLDVMDPEAAYLRWTFTLRTGVPEAGIREVFEFVEDDCDLTVQCVTPAAATATAPVRHAAEPLPVKVAESGGAHATPAQSIRVDVDKLDRLVNLVGEMVITQAMLTEESLLLPTDRFPGLLKGIEALAQSARELQDSVMAIRAQPVRSVFARMPRVVRDLAASLGKEARIVMTG